MKPEIKDTTNLKRIVLRKVFFGKYNFKEIEIEPLHLLLNRPTAAKPHTIFFQALKRPHYISRRSIEDNVGHNYRQMLFLEAEDPKKDYSVLYLTPRWE